MKSYNHLYEKTISETNRRYALSQAKHSKRFRKIMKHRHMSDDAAVEQSLDWIVNYENAEHVPVYIYDGITRKERTIIEMCIRDSINTSKGDKSITLIREGVSYNILNCLDKNTDWFTLAKGDNIFAFTADSGVTNLQFRIENKVIYEGV